MSGLRDLTDPLLIGTIEYNSYTMTPLRKVSTSFDPVYDSSGRSVIALDLKLKVIAIIQDDARLTHQTNMADAQHKLLEPGKRLIIKGIGLSTDLDTNTTPDLDYGPKPKILSCEPVGADLAWQIHWEVVYRLPPQCVWNRSIPPGVIIGAGHEVIFTTNEEGLVQRSISGHVDFRRARGVAFDPETVANRITVSKLPYMKRISFQRRFVEARNRIEYSCVDEELVDSAYPEGIIQADVNYELENQPPGFAKWTGQLSGTLRTAPGVKKSLAADKFFIILFDQAKKLRDTAKASGGIVIPERFRVGASKFGRTSRFMVTWRLIACLHDILKRSGLWEEVPGTSYVKWSNSMDDLGINSIRGASTIQMVDQDTLVNLCENIPSGIDIGGATGLRFSNGFGKSDETLSCSEVTKENSYVFYENRIRGVQSQNAVIHRVMQFFGRTTVSGNDNGSASMFPNQQSGAADDVVQYQGKNDNFVLMQGRAVRLKFTPIVPHLEKVVGVPVEEMARNVETKTVAGYFDCPMIQTKWAILYRVQKQLYGVQPANAKELCFLSGEYDGRK